MSQVLLLCFMRYQFENLLNIFQSWPEAAHWGERMGVHQVQGGGHRHQGGHCPLQQKRDDTKSTINVKFRCIWKCTAQRRLFLAQSVELDSDTRTPLCVTGAVTIFKNCGCHFAAVALQQLPSWKLWSLSKVATPGVSTPKMPAVQSTVCGCKSSEESHESCSYPGLRLFFQVLNSYKHSFAFQKEAEQCGEQEQCFYIMEVLQVVLINKYFYCISYLP